MVTQLYTFEKDFTICKSYFDKKNKRIFIPSEIPPYDELEQPFSPRGGNAKDLAYGKSVYKNRVNLYMQEFMKNKIVKLGDRTVGQRNRGYNHAKKTLLPDTLSGSDEINDTC